MYQQSGMCQQQGFGMTWPSSSFPVVFHNLQPSNVWEQINEANMQKISGKFHYGPISTKLFLQQSSKMSGLVMTVEDLKGGGCKFSIRGSRQSGKLELTFFGSEIMGSQVVAAILSNKKPVLLLFLLFLLILQYIGNFEQ